MPAERREKPTTFYVGGRPSGRIVKLTKGEDGSYVCSECHTYSSPEASQLQRHLNGHVDPDAPRRQSARGATSSKAAAPDPHPPLAARQAISVDRERVTPPSSTSMDAERFTPAIADTDPITATIVKPEWLWAHGLFLLQPLGCIVCVTCDHGILANEVLLHMAKIHRIHTLSGTCMDALIREHGLPLSRKTFVLPKQPLYEVAGLTIKPGFICTSCRHIRGEKKKVLAHIEKDHAWVEGVEARPCTFQDVFATTHGTRIEVVVPTTSLEQEPMTPADVLRRHMLCHPQYYNPPLTSRPDPRTVHPFLRISGWQTYAQGIERDTLRNLKELMKPTEVMRADCRALLEDLQTYCTPDSYTPRCLVASPLKNTQETAPFEPVSTMETLKRYADEIAHSLSFTVNAFNLADEYRRFTLLPTQTQAIRQFLAIQAHEGLPAHQRREAVFELFYALVTEHLGQARTFVHPFIAFTILHHIGPDFVFQLPENISPYLSGLQYAIRAMVYRRANLRSTVEDITLLAAVEKERCWITEGEYTFFSWVRQYMHLTATFAYQAERLPRFISSQDGVSFLLDGERITFASVTNMIQFAVRKCHLDFDALREEYGIPRKLIRADSAMSGRPLTDMLTQTANAFDFTRHGPNSPLVSCAEQIRDLVVNNGRFCSAIEGELCWFPGPIKHLLRMSEAWLKQLAVVMYWSSGQPSRGTELMATLIRNLPTRVRNILMVNGTIVNVGMLNKTTFTLKQDKLIPRAVPPLVSDIMASYIAFLRPLELIFTMALKQIPMEKAMQTTTRLFHINGRQFETRDLTNGLMELTKEKLGVEKGLGTSDCRHLSIFIAHKHLGPQVISDERCALLDLQAGHSSEVARRWYGVEAEHLGGQISSAKLEAFMEASRIMHRFHGLLDVGQLGEAPQPLDATDGQDAPVVSSGVTQALSTPSSSMPPFDMPRQLSGDRHGTSPPEASLTTSPRTLCGSFGGTSSGTLIESGGIVPTQTFLDTMVSMLTGRLQPILKQAVQIQRAPILSFPAPAPSAATIPASVDASRLHALHEVHPNARFLSVEQAQIVELASQGIHHLIGVLPTGGGKSAVWEVNARRERQQGRFTVVLAPFNALLDQHKARAEAIGVTTQRFTTMGTPPADLIFVGFDKTANHSFWEWLKVHAGPASPGGPMRLVRFIIDEAHYLLDKNNQEFRPNITHTSRLSSFGVPVVCLTATLPPSHVRDLSLCLNLHNPREIRAYTGRQNIRYSARKIPKVGYMDADTEAAHACQAIWEALSSFPRGRRIIVYFQDLKVLDAVFGLYRVQYGSVGKFHAKMTLEDSTLSMNEWGSGFSTLFASKACGLGIDRPDVDYVFHWECPTSLVDYAQESGRAGRKGQAAEAVILYTRLPSIPTENRNGRAELIATLDSSVCRRQVLEAFMDGEALNCLSRPANTRLCDNCEAQMSTTHSQPPLTLISPPSSAPVQTAQQLPPTPTSPPNSTPAQTMQQPELRVQPVASTSNSQEPASLLKIVRNLKGRCAVCYLNGHGRQNGNAFGCQAHRAMDLGTHMAAFKRSIDWPRVKCTYICWRCYLTKEYHENEDNRYSKPGCPYENVVLPIMYWVWHDLEWRRAAQEWIGEEFVNVGAYIEWCKKERVKIYNVMRLVRWVDMQLGAAGKWSVTTGKGAI